MTPVPSMPEPISPKMFDKVKTHHGSQDRKQLEPINSNGYREVSTYQTSSGDN